jgi:tetratricopeptide (TPR) repeat protein
MSADNPAAAGAATAADAAARRPRGLEDLIAAGNAALAERRIGDAAMAFRKAVLLVPKDWRGYERLANLLRRTGRFDEAHKVAERGLAQAPDAPAMLVEVGQCRRLLSRGDPVAPLKRACELAPERAEYHSLLGEAYLETNRQQRPAAAAFKRALDLDPGNPQRMIRYAGVLAMIGKETQAEKLLAKAAKRAPDAVEVWIAAARFAQIMGRPDDAQAAWQRVIALAPDSADAMTVLLTQFPETVDDALRNRAIALAADEKSGVRNRRRLNFALYALDRHREDYDAAFRHLAEGNRLRREELISRERGYGRDSRERYFSRIIETFNPGFFARTRGMGSESDQPIFILGMPRSGTTLCEQILASHSKVFGAGELEGIRDIARLLPRALARQGEIPGGFPFGMDRLTPELVRRFADRYLAQAAQLTNLPRITDKMPSNYVHVGLIHLLFPNAKIVHCVRDPLDNCLSCFEQNFSHPTSWSWDLEDIGHYYGQYRRLMAHWKAVLPVPMLEFSYEATVADVETGARRLLDFCGLKWEPACLDFHQTERPVLTASKGQVRRPIYTSSMGKWRVFERQLEPLRQAIAKAEATWR